MDDLGQRREEMGEFRFEEKNKIEKRLAEELPLGEEQHFRSAPITTEN